MKVLYRLGTYIRCMKCEELHHDGHVSFLTDCVVMAPKQRRVILVGGDRASGHGLSVRPVRDACWDTGMVYAQALYLSAGL